jgi:hypothetical protein
VDFQYFTRDLCFSAFMCLLGCGNFSALNCTSWVYDIDEERCRHLSWFKKHAIPLITLFALGFSM